MTENYRPAIELSLSILARRPRMASSAGDGKAFGVLLDMAEIWELYVAKLLQVSLPGLRVVHRGRATEHIRSLLIADGDELGSLRPDVLIFDHEGRCRAIADAEYKTTRAHALNRIGVVTDDLYQLTAYLAGFGDPASRLDGFLIYPGDPEGQVARRLGPKNPWRVASTPSRQLWFASVNCGRRAAYPPARSADLRRRNPMFRSSEFWCSDHPGSSSVACTRSFCFPVTSSTIRR
ncbi:5-methylcytosine restriction system specificity protein McrC [Bradyrhizobium sp. UFLA05-153]